MNYSETYKRINETLINVSLKKKYKKVTYLRIAAPKATKVKNEVSNGLFKKKYKKEISKVGINLRNLVYPRPSLRNIIKRNLQ